MNESPQQDMGNNLNTEGLDQKEHQTLGLLLEKLQTQKDHHLVLQVQMGEITSYLTSVTLEWITDKVNFATDLPLFRKREFNERARRVPFEQEIMELRQQRQPDWRRQSEMSRYLATRRHHKFPPLLLAGYQPWIHEEQHEKWGDDGRAAHDSLALTRLEPSGTYWDLDASEAKFYALDGQHRLMAFLGLRDLIRNGRLPILDKNGNIKGNKELSLEEVVDDTHKRTGENPAEIHHRLQILMSESIGVEIIPAVHRGEAYTEAFRRLRQLFVDVNEKAKSLTKAEYAQFDETNGYRIIARRLCQEHELFTSGITVDRKTRLKVNLEKNQLSETDDDYTTLQTLAETVRRYLKENKNLPNNEDYASWDSLVDRDIRPEESLLDQGMQEMFEYFDRLKKLPSHTALIRGKPAGDLRRSGAGDNILFRPIVQTALAEALGKLAARGVSLQAAAEKLARGEENGQLRLTRWTAPWRGVASDSDGRMRRDTRYESLCCRLFQHLLGGGIPDDLERRKLGEDFAAARQTDPEKGVAINLDGDHVKTHEVQLPDPWH